MRLAALRHLFDWMVIGQIMPTNPASAVRGPRHIVRRGKTPVPDPLQARQLIDAIDTTTVIGLRDRALIGLMVYSFARTPRDYGSIVHGARANALFTVTNIGQIALTGNALLSGSVGGIRAQSATPLAISDFVLTVDGRTSIASELAAEFRTLRQLNMWQKRAPVGVDFVELDLDGASR